MSGFILRPVDPLELTRITIVKHNQAGIIAQTHTEMRYHYVPFHSPFVLQTALKIQMENFIVTGLTIIRFKATCDLVQIRQEQYRLLGKQNAPTAASC